MTGRSASLCFMLFVLLFGTFGILSSHGQDLTRLSDVVAVKPKDATNRPRTVKLRGVVTEVAQDKESFTIQEGDAGIGVKLDVGVACPKFGDEVECEGVTFAHAQARYLHTRVRATKVTTIGPGELPKPLSLTVKELNSFKNFERWVTTEGTVLKWKYNRVSNGVAITLSSDNLWTTVLVRTQSRPTWLERFIGARVRVTGINSGNNTHDMTGAMLVPTSDHLEVLQTGMASTFDAPLVSMRDVARGKYTPDKRVKVRGVIAWTQNLRIFVRDDKGGALINNIQTSWQRLSQNIEEYGDAGPYTELKSGMEVEVVGTPPVFTGYGMTYCDVRVIGEGKLAPPEKVEIEVLKAQQNKDDWVALEGVVSAWCLNGSMMVYSLRGPRDTIVATIPDVGAGQYPRDLHGAHMRFTGAVIAWNNGTNSGTNFFIPSLAFAEIVKPGRENPFDAPLAKTADVLKHRVPVIEPLKLKGVLVGRTDKSLLHVRCADGAICVKLRTPLPRNAGNATRIASDSTPVPPLTFGDQIEVVAWPSLPADDAASDVVDADVRVTGHLEKVPPVVTTLSKISNGAHASDFVEVHGRLVSLNQLSVSVDEWRSTLLLEAGGVRLPAVLQTKDRPILDSLHVDDEVLVSAVVGRSVKRGTPQLLLAAASDARSLGVSPVVKQKQMWLWGCGAAVVFVGLVAWIASLRRSWRRQKEAAALLEQRVNERTSDLKKAQSELERALEQERELSELKTRFVSMVSHEFRTPLGIIMSAVELLQHYSDRLPEEEKQRQLHEIQSGTKHMGDLMEQVLLLGRAEAGKLICKPHPLDLAAFAERIIDETQSVTDRRCRIILDLDGDLSEAMADESVLRHIFRNLVVNAVKYSPEGSEVKVRIRRDGKTAVFEVIDRGIGIPEKDRPRLFDAFHRCSNVGDTPGTGLGLVIVKRCVDVHGGTIDLHSEPGVGTTFIVTIPVFS